MARSDYHERQDARRERLERAAERARSASDAAYAAADEIAKRRPLGQPILVGHHSERGARADQRRIERNMDRSVAELRRSQELDRRAEAVGKGGVSSDDPDAVEKLERKLRELESRQEKRKAVNVAWRRAGRPAPNDSDAWAKLAPELPLSDTGVHQLRLRMAQHQSWGDPSPFPAYALKNTNAEVRRLKQRIEELRRADSSKQLEQEHGVCRLVESPDDNRVQLFFDGKPEDSVRTLLKQQGFRWARSVGAWQRHLNDAGRAAARYVIERLKEGAS